MLGRLNLGRRFKIAVKSFQVQRGCGLQLGCFPLWLLYVLLAIASLSIICGYFTAHSKNLNHLIGKVITTFCKAKLKVFVKTPQMRGFKY